MGHVIIVFTIMVVVPVVICGGFGAAESLVKALKRSRRHN